MTDRGREICETCNGTGRVIDETQAGEPVATCMICKGNGWIQAGKTQPRKVNEGWLQAPKPSR